MRYPFIAARNYTRGRQSPIDLLVVHTMEAPERRDTAEQVARWFAGASAPRASAHYCIDADSVVQCVRDRDVAWHAPGANHNGLGLEHAGRARQTAREWRDPYSDAMLERSAKLAAEKCRRYGIPAVWLYPADLRAGRRGITSHVNVSLAFRRSSHTDPGRHFPVERYVRAVRRRLRAARPAPDVKRPPPTLRRGDSGWRVRRLQRLLERQGWRRAVVDGIFGAATEQAVRRFQRRRGLEPDGIVGPLTWRALEALA